MQFVNKKKWFYKRFSRKSRNINLGFNNLYIFPNKFGFYWILSCILLYILGTNLEAGLTILLSYLMMVILTINLFLTHFNLHGLELFSTEQDISFADSEISYQIFLNSNFTRFNLFLEFINERVEPIHIELIEGKKSIYINSKKHKRGIFNPGIILGKSSAPMSLFNCWFYWEPTEKIIVAPKMKKGITKQNYNFKDKSKQGKTYNFRSISGDELLSLKNYRKGDKRSQINWKYFAKTNKLTSKEFADLIEKTPIYKLQNNYPIEESLEYLSYEINFAYKNDIFYGVEISKDKFLEIGKGPKHYYSSMFLLASLEK